jgi:hypothetical protein
MTQRSARSGDSRFVSLAGCKPPTVTRLDREWLLGGNRFGAVTDLTGS